MPSLLLDLDAARLAVLRGTGAGWTVRWVDLGAPELERLHGGTLYLATIVDGHVRVIGHLVEEGEVTRCDVDVCDRLERIGRAAVAQLAPWARTARVLTPTDVDLLRYALGLPLDLAADPPPAPPAIAIRSRCGASPRARRARRALARPTSTPRFASCA